MKISYNRLWHLLLDRKINKSSLAKLANISTATLTKLSKDETVNTDMLLRICVALNCEVGDIMEITPDD